MLANRALSVDNYQVGRCAGFALVTHHNDLPQRLAKLAWSWRRPALIAFHQLCSTGTRDLRTVMHTAFLGP